MKEIRLHGLGGQGAVIASEILAVALAVEGWEVAAFPQFGAERRGSLVTAFVRFDDKPIREKCLVYYPHALLVLDHGQIHSPTTLSGIRPESTMVANAPFPVTNPPHPHIVVTATVDATKIAREVLGRPIINTCLVGAFAGATRWVGIDHVTDAMQRFFEGKILEKNVLCARRGYEEVSVNKILS